MITYFKTYLKKLQATSLRGFSIAEVLIAIVIITILTIGSIAVYSAQLQKARDTERKADLDRIRGYLDEIVGRFGSPPGTDPKSKKLKKIEECKTDSDLFKCFEKLQLSTEDDLIALLTDPRQDVNNDRATGSNTEYSYYFGSTENSYRICSMLEDQGAIDILNFKNDGVTEIDGTTVTHSGQDDMYCIDFLQPGGTPVSSIKKVAEPVSS